MAGYVTTVYVDQVTWNSLTWNGDSLAGAGGVIRVSFSHFSSDIQDRTGSFEYPEFVQMVNKGCLCTVTLREVKQLSALGTKSNLVATLKSKLSSPTITMVGAILRDVGPSQGRAETGETTLTFVHESADGSAVPIS